VQTLRYGIVGGGFNAFFHARALEQVRGVEIAGLVSRSRPERLAAFINERDLGEPLIFDSVRELAEHVDVVAIMAPNDVRLDHIGQLADAVAAGAELKGVICEKPLARNLAEARELLRLMEPTGLPTAYFENQIHMKQVKAARQQLAQVMAAMGPPLLIRSGEEHAGPHAAWFWDPQRQGGGVMSDMGCHCLGVGWWTLTPPGKPVDFLRPVSVQADLSLLKWGQPKWRQQLLDQYGVDYAKTPAEDFATGMVTYKNPESGQISKAQFSVSWMFDKQAMRLALEAIGPGYAIDMSTLRSSLEVFIGDAAAAGVADSEVALEKSQASRGQLPVQPNEADLYGYVDENLDALAAFRAGRSALLDWNYGLEIVRLTMAAYLSHERQATVDLTDQAMLDELETYVPLIQQGRGGEVL